MKAASMIVLYDVASLDVVGHVILDHVSLIPSTAKCITVRLCMERGSSTMFSQMPTETCMGVVKQGMQPLRRMHVHY